MSSKRRWAVTAGVMTGMFIAALEATVVGTAMPTVIASLGGLNHYSWVFSAYLVTSTVTVPVWGKLSDLYGRRILYQIGIVIFLIGSVLSGMSETMTQLIIFRAVQGLGAGALVPLGMTIIGDIFTLEERAKMQAYFSGVWGLSSVIGPVVGGFITDQISWRWVFYINVPIGIVAALIIGIALKEPKLTEKPKIDYAGAGILMLAISLLMLALVEGGASLATLLTPVNIGLILSAIVLLLIFFWIEKRASDPIIPFNLFKNRTVSVSIGAGFLAGVAMFGAISFVPLFAQAALGLTATEAGSLLTPLMLSWVFMSIIGGRVLLKTGYRPITIAGFITMTVGFILLSMFRKRNSAFLAVFRSGFDRRGTRNDDADTFDRGSGSRRTHETRRGDIAQSIFAGNRRRVRRGGDGRVFDDRTCRSVKYFCPKRKCETHDRTSRAVCFKSECVD